MTAPINVWRFTDGKAGHENQVQGLVRALAERCPVEEYRIHIAECRKGLIECLRGHDPFGAEHASPDLIIGAGRGTHLPMLNARRIRGGKVIVLMKPALPVAWFDLCIIPAHDRPRHADNVLISRGVLHSIRPSGQLADSEGLILVGGPSPHVHWSDEAMAGQVRAVVAGSPGVHWTLTTSRRTPATFLGELAQTAMARMTVVPAEQCPPGWLSQRFAQAGTVWVSADSVSMVYEALGTGAAVGLLPVPFRKSRDRLLSGLKQLQHDGLLTDLAAWQAGVALRRPATVLDEAGRCADWIVEHWLSAD